MNFSCDEKHDLIKRFGFKNLLILSNPLFASLKKNKSFISPTLLRINFLMNCILMHYVVNCIVFIGLTQIPIERDELSAYPYDPVSFIRFKNKYFRFINSRLLVQQLPV